MAERIISDKECLIVGISPFIDSYKQSIRISEKIKELRPEVIICWGGHLATFSANEILKNENCVDYVVMGEGESTFLELAEIILKRKRVKLNEIRGIAYKNKGRIFINRARDLIGDLDELPFPDRGNTFQAVKEGALVQISGSRGCYGNCSFCSISSLYGISRGNKWRGRDPQNIVSELFQLNHKYGYTMFKFVDDSFFGPGREWGERALRIADEIIKRKLKIRFRISTRANNVDRKVFKKLKSAGLYAVSIGIESGVQRALNTFKKGMTVEQNRMALMILEELKIVTLMGYIGFDPYTTLEELEENLKFLKENYFCISDLISKPLFVHAGDEITSKLLEEKRIQSRDFPNYLYKIEDERAEKAFDCIKTWNDYNKKLYYKIIDPLSSPRITKKSEENAILSLCVEMRKIDIEIFGEIIKMIKDGYGRRSIKKRLKEFKNIYELEWKEIDERFNKIMKNNEYIRQ